MKIYINRKPVSGPWGGGSKILAAIITALTRAGHEVVHDLVPAIDVLFCVDPRDGSEKGLYGYLPILQYARQDGKARIVQRVGDLGTHSKPDLSAAVLNSVLHSDTVVFPSRWAYDAVEHALLINDRRPQRQWHVVPNAPMAVFFKHRSEKTQLPNSLSFVSHHWSTNKLKGFDFYQALDARCLNQNDRFTFYGRLPDGIRLTNDRGSLNENQLADELPKHDVYVTASRLEAGANHVLEAIAAGLPVIYHQDGGSINEYSAPYGVSFDGSMTSFERAVEHVRSAYPKFRKNIRKFRTTVDDVAAKYVSVIESVTK